MVEELLVNERIDAGRKFVEKFNEFKAIDVAFWVVTPDSENAFLYIASDGINDSNFDVAYGEVLELVKKLEPTDRMWVDPFQIKVVNPKEPIAQAALDVSAQGRMPTWLGPSHHGISLGDTPVERAYIYPQLTS